MLTAAEVTALDHLRIRGETDVNVEDVAMGSAISATHLSLGVAFGN